MKNRLSSLLLSCLFLLGSLNLSYANQLELDGGTEAYIINLKTGTPICVITVSEKYLDKNGDLALPMEVTILQDGKVPAFSTVSKSLQIELPKELSGNFTIHLRVGDLFYSQKITI